MAVPTSPDFVTRPPDAKAPCGRWIIPRHAWTPARYLLARAEHAARGLRAACRMRARMTLLRRSRSRLFSRRPAGASADRLDAPRRLPYPAGTTTRSRAMSDWTFPKGDLMKGKRGLVMGVANDRSIAWGIAQQLAAQGADIAFTYQGEALERRVRPLIESIGMSTMISADVTNDAEMDTAFAAAEAKVRRNRLPRPRHRLRRQGRAARAPSSPIRRARASAARWISRSTPSSTPPSAPPQ